MELNHCVDENHRRSQSRTATGDPWRAVVKSPWLSASRCAVVIVHVGSSIRLGGGGGGDGRAARETGRRGGRRRRLLFMELGEAR